MFRRYEQHILAILTNYPRSSSFNPRPLSVNTFKCRFRDSVASLLEYNWTSPVDVGRLREVWPDMEVVSDDSGFVTARKIGSGKLAPAGRETAVGQAPNNYIFALDNPESSVFWATVILLDKKVIQFPVKVKNISRALLGEASEKFDITINEEPDGFTIL